MHALTPLALAALALTATALPSPGGGNSNGGHGHGHKKTIGVQGHRGGLGMRSEESLWAYAYSMEIGVNTLEMDTVFTKDGVPGQSSSDIYHI
jgi:glycerophosphoryl diester phosphodiesterase